jgi:uncharacterized membrane protein required for colicin V production
MEKQYKLKWVEVESPKVIKLILFLVVTTISTVFVVYNMGTIENKDYIGFILKAFGGLFIVLIMYAFGEFWVNHKLIFVKAKKGDNK